MDPEMALGLVVGGVAGIVVGRIWAENARARSEMKKTWQSRSDYRK